MPRTRLLSTRRPPVAAALLASAAVVLAAGGLASPAAASGDGPVVTQADPFTTDAPGLGAGQIEMTTISTRPGLVTGGEARVAVRGLQPDDVLTVTRDGDDVSAAFERVPSRPGQAPGAAEGLVTGLALGPNVLRATAVDARYGARAVTLTVTDHSLQGPVITGPHQEPFVCQTEASGMGPSSPPDCVAPTQVHWWYEDDLGNFHQLADPYAPYPSGTATTTVNGRTVPFVVRVESIVINRSVTRIAVLDDPHARGPNKPFTPDEWNHRLVYHFGESCGTGYHQGSDSEAEVFGQLSSVSSSNLAGPFMELSQRLGDGYMVAQSTLTIFGVHCNQVLSAETLMMVKEHVVDAYGDVAHVISGGASGGAIQQYTIADQYPGLIDAGTPLLSFPDVISTAMTVYDCVLMEPVFQADQNRWNPVKQVAVTGLATPQVCQDWTSLFGGNLNPKSCPSGIPPAEVYDAKTNPSGVRCDLQDDLKNLVGVDPTTGFAYRPLADVGVQYGLDALRQGLISADDFIELNRDVGGLSLDDEHIPTRVAMTPQTAQRVYELGFVGQRGGIDLTPMIDQTIPISDVTPELDIHDQIRPFEIRARLDQTYGNHDSQAIWSGLPLPGNAIQVADQWLDSLDALQAQHPDWSRAQLVTASRPAAAADQCRVLLTGVPAACDQGVARHSSPRQVAGGPFAEDNVDCQLRPVARSDYPSSLTDAQFAQIRQVFAGGVCDYTTPSVGWTARSQTWLSYGADGQLNATPVAVPYPLVRSAVPTASAGTPAGSPEIVHPADAAPGGGLADTGLPAEWPWLAALLAGAAALLAAGRRGRRPSR